MSNRREFFKSIAAFLPAVAGLRLCIPTYQLEVGCDLSLTSLQWALNEGEVRKFGNPKTLIIGPENTFPAREILGTPGWPYSNDPMINALRNDNLEYEIVRHLPMNTWQVRFERGIVESRGPQ